MPNSKSFLITGAASGIGKALVTQALARGHRVVAIDLDDAVLEKVAAAESWPTERLLCQKLDVRDSRGWSRVVAAATERFGRLDVAINVAGVLMPARLDEIKDHDVDQQIDVNLKGVIYGTRAAARIMNAQGEGHIINIASLAALAPIPGLAIYSASKFAVRAFSLAVADELRGQGVAITVVCPDAVKTPMLDLQKSFEQANLTFTAPRFLEPQEIAELILGPVLEKRPLLVSKPRSRALLARIADLWPRSARILAPWLEKRGRKVRLGGG
jgi:3-oxoacyl-[acyl-carrier protein] reductase